MTLIDYKDHECVGCGKTSDELAKDEDITDEQFDEYSVATPDGSWYCHSDCYRDSK